MSAIPPSPYAATILRVSLGLMYLTHSLVLKVGTFGIPGTMKFFESIGLPGFVAILVIAAEAVGGAMLMLGVKTRAVALALVPILVGAACVHAGNGWVFTAPGGGWEYPVFLAIAVIVQALLGDGAVALSPRSTTAPARAAARAGRAPGLTPHPSPRS